VCGIAGFIGNSTNWPVSFRLITALFEECQSRGVDAAGFWGVESDDSCIVYHKEPIKASDFIKKTVWTDLSEYNLNLMVVHARGASTGVGIPSDNINNHPFVSFDKTIGLVHNGRIPDTEYDVLTKRYEVVSKCDSEILLRIFEGSHVYTAEEMAEYKELDPVLAERLIGLRDIWSFIDKGHMAVAIGERPNQFDRRLFLFRNKHRSLWLADLRKELGQVFFCSTPDIWSNAFKSSGTNRIIKNRVKLCELPTEELWTMSIDENTPVVEKINKYDIHSNGRTLWKPPEGDVIKIVQTSPKIPIITKLNDLEEVMHVSKKEKVRYYKDVCGDSCGYPDPDETPWDADPSMPEVEELSQACDSIIDKIKGLHNKSERTLIDGLMSKKALKDLLESLEQIEADIDGTIQFIGK